MCDVTLKDDDDEEEEETGNGHYTFKIFWLQIAMWIKSDDVVVTIPLPVEMVTSK